MAKAHSRAARTPTPKWAAMSGASRVARKASPHWVCFRRSSSRQVAATATAIPAKSFRSDPRNDGTGMNSEALSPLVKSHSEATRDRARVAMATWVDARRSDRAPNRSPAAIPTTRVMASAGKKSRPWSLRKASMVNTPVPTRAPWPRLNWPVHPPATTIDRATRT